MRIHSRKTYTDGAKKMVETHEWHGSRPLSMIEPGDILRVTNKDSGEVVDWRVTVRAVSLSQAEAKAEWEKNPFGTLQNARAFKFYPYVLRQLERIGLAQRRTKKA